MSNVREHSERRLIDEDHVEDRLLAEADAIVRSVSYRLRGGGEAQYQACKDIRELITHLRRSLWEESGRAD